MIENRFIEQMEENVKFSLIYPYHIHYDKLMDNMYHNPEHKNSHHTHSFAEVLRVAYLEAKAFYLTEEDKAYYSAQEIDFINKVLADECTKIDKGMAIVNLDIDEETMEMLDEYKIRNNMTFEEAIVDILTKAVQNPERLEELIANED